MKNLRKIFYTDAAFKNKKMGFSRDIKSIFPTGMFSELVIDGLEISDKVDVQFKYLSERRKINLAMLAIWYKDVFQKIWYVSDMPKFGLIYYIDITNLASN